MKQEAELRFCFHFSLNKNPQDKKKNFYFGFLSHMCWKVVNLTERFAGFQMNLEVYVHVKRSRTVKANYNNTLVRHTNSLP